MIFFHLVYIYIQTLRTPISDRKWKRQNITPGNNSALDPSFNSAVLAPVNDPNEKGLKKMNEYFSKHTPASPLRSMQTGILSGSRKSPCPFNVTPGMYPQSPQAQFVSSLSVGQPSLPSTEYASLIQPLKLPAVTKTVQTDLSSQLICELVTWEISWSSSSGCCE